MKFLTADEKDFHLANWHAVRSGERPAGDLAGLGWPDLEIYELTDRLNAIDGLCTVQSCSGHPRARIREWSAPGQLWIRLNEAQFQHTLAHVDELIARQPVTVQNGKPFCENQDHWSVSYLFERQDGVLDLKFPGLDVGPEALAESSDIIAGFFS